MRAFVRLMTLTLLLLLTLPSCKEGDSVDAGGDTQVEVVPPYVYMPPDPDTFICNPFDASLIGDRTQGLMGSLYYTLPGETHFNHATEYIQYAHPVSEVSLFFNQINVPTRPFDHGFVTRSGEVIKTPAGNTLYEYFGIHFQGNITLNNNDTEGLYQFALLADDGAVFSLQDSSGNWQTLIDNDGVHPTRMGCATTPVDMKRGSYIPMDLKYYQGPRYHIAMVLMWRPWNGSAHDPSCGTQGNSLFFNSQTDPSTPQPAYNALLTRGWQVVSPSHYRLQAPSQNPCNEPAPLVEDYIISQVTSTSVRVSWITVNVAALGRVELTEVATGQISTHSQKGFSTTHTINITNLKPNTLYSVKALSESSSGLTTVTDSVEFLTPP